MKLSAQEIAALKDLGLQNMEIAAHPMQTEKLRLWKSLNRNAMERPMGCIDQLSWNELKVHDDISPRCHCSCIYNDQSLPSF